MTKLLLFMAALVVALSTALYLQIKKSGEIETALKHFQAALATQVEENHKINQLVIARDKANQEAQQTTDTLKRRLYDTKAQLDKTDCVHRSIHDSIRVLIPGQSGED